MSTSELILGWKALNEALPAYEEAETYAESEMDEVFASAQIKAKLSATSDYYKFGLIRTPISVRADRCEIAAIKVPDQQKATELITKIYDANDMGLYYPGQIFDTFMYGDTYTQIWELPEDIEDEEETVDDQLHESRVVITTHGPKHVRIMYDPENQRRKWFAIKRWKFIDKSIERWRVDLYFADTVERYVSVGSDGLEDAHSWLAFTDEDQEDWELENPFGEIPFFHHRTALPYGKPVHKAGYGCQNAITKMLVTQVDTTDSQGFPQRYALVDVAAELDSNTDSPDWFDDSEASTASVGGLKHRGGEDSALRTGPGTMQTLTGMKEVGQFPAAEPANFLDPAEFYIKLMAQLTTTPFHYFDPAGDVPSGESLKVADAPLVKSIQWLQLLQSNAIEEEWRFALLVAGVKVDAVEVRWDQVNSATGLDDWQIVKAKQDAGVPVEQTLVETGYEPETVATWLDETAEAATLAQRVALLGAIGQAISSIGSGVALGVVTEQEAQAAVSLVLNQVNESGKGVPE